MGLPRDGRLLLTCKGAVATSPCGCYKLVRLLQARAVATSSCSVLINQALPLMRQVSLSISCFLHAFHQGRYVTVSSAHHPCRLYAVYKPQHALNAGHLIPTRGWHTALVERSLFFRQTRPAPLPPDHVRVPTCHAQQLARARLLPSGVPLRYRDNDCALPLTSQQQHSDAS